MSKKETRRAARGAFPKATSAPRGGVATRPKGSKAAPRGAGGARSKSAAARRPALRPPTLKRAVIQGAVLAVLYFIVVQFLWVQKDPVTGQKHANVVTSLIVAAAGFVIYTGIAYAIDKFTYQRRLRKLKGSSK
jgi:hypothetical protein